jgi:hypothetical protein
MFRSLSSPLSAYEFPKSCNKCSLVVAVTAQSLCLNFALLAPNHAVRSHLDPTMLQRLL